MSFRLQASYVSKAHTAFASAAFLSALLVGLRLHYRKIVKNEVAGYPDEWWPSVSATIGDWYPERSIFQLLIALTAGPRFVLIFCWWLLTRSTTSALANFVAICGVARTFFCGGWVYITSSDDHNAHDILMISYMFLNLPWMTGTIISTTNVVNRSRRKLVATLFFVAIIPMVYFFIQHKLYKVPGAYTKYSFCEWFLIFADIWFDSITANDFSLLEISVSRTVTKPSQRKRLSIVDEPKLLSKHMSSVRPHAASNTQFSSTDSQSRIPLSQALYLWFGLLGDWRSIASFSADVYLAYVWWSNFTCLAPSLFYFSVWQLSISGQEISLFSTLSPILLGVSSIRANWNTHRGRTRLQMLSIFGLVAYKVQHPLLRLFAVTFANACGSLLRAMEWSNEQEAERHGIILTLGLAMSSLSKLANRSVNPIWPIVDGQSGGWNKTGIFLAVLAVREYATRNLTSVAPGSRSAAPASSETPASSTEHPQKPIPVTQSSPRFFGHWSLSSISLGGLIFSVHCFLTDSGTLIAYSWSGYPISGPVPGFHGHLTLIATVLGVYISCSSMKVAIRHPAWMTVGVMSTYFMYQWRDWSGYIAGLCLATFLSSLVPEIIRMTAFHGKQSPGKVYFSAWLTVCLLDLAHVWTVAYAFVPAGNLLRERTDIVLSMQTLALGSGIVAGWWGLLLSAPRPSIDNSFRILVGRLLAMLILTTFLATTAWLPPKTPLPHHTPHRLITAGIWTVHFGIDDAGRESQYRIRDLIKDMELDVVGLLETDVHRVVFGNRDLTRVIAEDLGYYVDIGPGPNTHTWGAALLSKFPILMSTHHLLPSPNGELAPAISAVLDIWGQNVTVVVSHNGQEEDAVDRELQSIELARIMASTYPEPVIFLGYVVSTPLAPRPNPYEILVTDGQMHDIDDEDWDRWCEYILYRGLYRVSYARVSRSTVTDTELQVGKFVVPKTGYPVVNASRADRYLRSYREVLPSSMWFPDEYSDMLNPGGIRGHFYHVHPWPLYYRLPDSAVI